MYRKRLWSVYSLCSFVQRQQLQLAWVASILQHEKHSEAAPWKRAQPTRECHTATGLLELHVYCAAWADVLHVACILACQITLLPMLAYCRQQQGCLIYCATWATLHHRFKISHVLYEYCQHHKEASLPTAVPCQNYIFQHAANKTLLNAPTLYCQQLIQ